MLPNMHNKVKLITLQAKDMSIKVTGIPILKDNYCWIITHKQDCLIVDPGDSQPVIDHIKQMQLKPQAILATHHHWDHTDGIGEILQIWPECQVIATQHEPVPHKTTSVTENAVITLGHFPPIHVYIKPGHTKYHALFHIENALFTGDTLFIAGCGRAFECSPHKLWQSVSWLSHLTKELLIYCGHEYTVENLAFATHVLPNDQNIKQAYTLALKMRSLNIPTVPQTIGEQYRNNIFLRCHEPEIWQACKSAQPIDNAEDCFVFLRNWKNSFFSGKI